MVGPEDLHTNSRGMYSGIQAPSGTQHVFAHSIHQSDYHKDDPRNWYEAEMHGNYSSVNNLQDMYHNKKPQQMVEMLHRMLSPRM